MVRNLCASLRNDEEEFFNDLEAFLKKRLFKPLMEQSINAGFLKMHGPDELLHVLEDAITTTVGSDSAAQPKDWDFEDTPLVVRMYRGAKRGLTGNHKRQPSSTAKDSAKQVLAQLRQFREARFAHIFRSVTDQGHEALTEVGQNFIAERQKNLRLDDLYGHGNT